MKEIIEKIEALKLPYPKSTTWEGKGRNDAIDAVLTILKEHKEVEQKEKIFTKEEVCKMMCDFGDFVKQDIESTPLSSYTAFLKAFRKMESVLNDFKSKRSYTI